MASRSLNKVQLIGNLTRDPELRYTPQGTAVCTFGLATNRYWTTDAGEKREETEFHRIVSWNKLAEICSQLLTKGRKVYVEGRLSSRSWTAQDGTQRTIVEIIIDDMLLLDSRRLGVGETTEEILPPPPGETPQVVPPTVVEEKEKIEETPEVTEVIEATEASDSAKKKKGKSQEEEVKIDAGDIPF